MCLSEALAACLRRWLWEPARARRHTAKLSSSSFCSTAVCRTGRRRRRRFCIGGSEILRRCGAGGSVGDRGQMEAIHHHLDQLVQTLVLPTSRPRDLFISIYLNSCRRKEMVTLRENRRFRCLWVGAVLSYVEYSLKKTDRKHARLGPAGPGY